MLVMGNLFKTPFIELTIPNDLVITHNIPLFNPVITQGMPRSDTSDKIIGLYNERRNDNITPATSNDDYYQIIMSHYQDP
jgi:hypothetical protein